MVLNHPPSCFVPEQRDPARLERRAPTRAMPDRRRPERARAGRRSDRRSPRRRRRSRRRRRGSGARGARPGSFQSVWRMNSTRPDVPAARYRGAVAPPGKHARGARERGNHQTVPCRQHLVVEVRPRPPLAGRQRVSRAHGRARRPPLPASARLAAAMSSTGCDDVEQVPARELALRILRRVAVRLDAESPPHDRRIVAQAARRSRASVQM